VTSTPEEQKLNYIELNCEERTVHLISICPATAGTSAIGTIPTSWQTHQKFHSHLGRQKSAKFLLCFH